jgi:hypothetical protein
MHPIIMQALASQRIAQLRAAAVSRHRRPSQPAGTASSISIRQRIGWALVQVGLRLAVRHARA